jgi:hypothetical protein
MDAESQQVEDLRARVTELEEESERLNERVVFLAAANTVNEKLIRDKNQIIRELCAWLDSEFRFDTWPPESPGRQLMDRAQATIR